MCCVLAICAKFAIDRLTLKGLLHQTYLSAINQQYSFLDLLWTLSHCKTLSSTKGTPSKKNTRKSSMDYLMKITLTYPHWIYQHLFPFVSYCLLSRNRTKYVSFHDKSYTVLIVCSARNVICKTFVKTHQLNRISSITWFISSMRENCANRIGSVFFRFR